MTGHGVEGLPLARRDFSIQVDTGSVEGDLLDFDHPQRPIFVAGDPIDAGLPAVHLGVRCLVGPDVIGESEQRPDPRLPWTFSAHGPRTLLRVRG